MLSNPKTNFENKLNFWKHVSSSIAPFDHEIFNESGVNHQFKSKKYETSSLELKCPNAFNTHSDIKSEVNVKPYKNKDWADLKLNLCEKNTYYYKDDTKHKKAIFSNKYKDCCPKYVSVVLNDISKVTELKCEKEEKTVKSNKLFLSQRYKTSVQGEKKSLKMCNSKYSSYVSLLSSFVTLKTNSFSKNQKTLPKTFFKLENIGSTKGKHAKVKLNKIEDTVGFLSNFNLRPAWKNSDLYKSPKKLEKLTKLRNSVRDGSIR